MKEQSPKQSSLSLPFSLFKNLLLIGTSAMAIVALAFLFAIWRTSSSLFSGLEQFFDPAPVISQVDIPTLIVEQVRYASELTTAVFVMEAVVPTSAKRQWGNIPIATTKLLYIAQGEVRAGVDLSNISAKDVIIAEDMLTINLPAPKILDSKIDVNHSSVYHYDRGFLSLGPDQAPELQTLAQRQTLAKIVTAACTQGILTEANQRAELALTQLLAAAGYAQKVEVKTTTPSAEACDSLE